MKTVGTHLNRKSNLEGFFDYSPTLTYADVTYNLLFGYINATLGFSSLNQEKCIEILGKFYTNITRDMPNQIMNQRFKDFSLTNANVLRNIDPAVKSCVWTLDDAYDIYFKQGVSLSDLFRILFNFVYRFGNMVDRIYELYTI